MNAKTSTPPKHPIENLPQDKIAIFKKIAIKFGMPLYVYFEKDLKNNYEKFAQIAAPFGLTIRYAVKANTTGAVVKLLDKLGAHFDASTFNEGVRLIKGAQIDGSKISLTSQEVQSTEQLNFLKKNGVKYNACSLLQLETYGKLFPNTEIGIRFNIGIGSGWNQQTSTGGANAPFGIFEQRSEINKLIRKYNLDLETVHFHIGSGSDPKKQKEAIPEGLKIVRDYPSVRTINVGGGYKVARMQYEHTTDISEIGDVLSSAIANFKKDTGREIGLEMEPGGGLVVSACFILLQIVDIVNTGKNGKEFIKVNGGMNMNARIPMYGAQHPLVVIPFGNENSSIKEYAVCGICCESGDLLTVLPGKPDFLATRLMNNARVGDLLIVGGAGAYCSSMASLNYNSQQIHPEILVRENGELNLIRERQPLEDLWKYERIPQDLK